MSDRVSIPTMTATARGAYASSYRGEPRLAADGSPLWSVVVTSQVPSPWRPLPELVELEVSVPQAGVPSLHEGASVVLHDVVLRAAARQSGAPYLAASASSVTLTKGGDER